MIFDDMNFVDMIYNDMIFDDMIFDDMIYDDMNFVDMIYDDMTLLILNFSKVWNFGKVIRNSSLNRTINEYIKSQKTKL